MQTTIKKLPQSQVEVAVEVSPEEAQPYLVKAAAKLAAEIKIEGFRPGKAPYELVRQKIGEMAIWEAALDDIIAKTYFDALKENNIITVGQPKIDLEKLAPGNPLKYRAVAAILPAVKIGDYSAVKFTREKIIVKGEAIEKVIEDIRKMRATEAAVDREAKTGDRLVIDFDVFLDKVPIENGKHQKYPLTLGEGRFIPGFEEKLIGAKAGETREFSLKFPEDYFEKKLAGRLAEFKVVCHTVLEIALPTVDDEFVKQLSGGKFATVAALRENISENLLLEETNKAEQQLEIKVLDKLAEISEFEDIPEVLTHHEIHKMMHELEDSVARQGFEFEAYLQSLKKTREDLEKELAPAAEKRVKISIICREIFQTQKFAISADEVEKEISEIKKGYPDNPEVDKQLNSETYKDYLRQSLGNRKVIEYLKREMISG